MCMAVVALVSWLVLLLLAKTKTMPRISVQFAGALTPKPRQNPMENEETTAYLKKDWKNRWYFYIFHPPGCMLSPDFHICISRCAVLVCTSTFSMFLLNEFVGVKNTFALYPTWGIVLTVFHFVAMMSLARHRVIIRKIPMKLFIVTTVMMLARMLFTNLLNFLLIRILGEKVLSCLCTKNRFSAHEQFIYFLSHGHWISQ